MGDTYDYEPNPLDDEEKKSVCKYCGQKDLFWFRRRDSNLLSINKWVLVGLDGKIHDCIGRFTNHNLKPPGITKPLPPPSRPAPLMPTVKLNIEQEFSRLRILKDHEIREVVNELTQIARQFHNTQQLREQIAHVIVPLLKP